MEGLGQTTNKEIWLQVNTVTYPICQNFSALKLLYVSSSSIALVVLVHSEGKCMYSSDRLQHIMYATTYTDRYLKWLETT
jgi:hypothetical protein